SARRPARVLDCPHAPLPGYRLDWIVSLWSFITHLDVELAGLLQDYGRWVYAILFAIVFCETGLVVAPFLPGDSLLFVSGALWASANMRVEVLAFTLVAAAFSGDNCNYWIGRLFGGRIASSRHPRFLNQRALERTQAFYARH